jgi:hypothetical protein
VQYQEHLGIRENEDVCMIIDYRHVLNGFESIRTGLFNRMDACVAAHLAPDYRPPASPVADADPVVESRLIDRRLAGLTLPLVIVGGLTDGINPCAVAGLVFFLSLLSLARAPARVIVWTGIAFCAATYLTYFLIGFGLLRALYLLSGFARLRQGIEIGMAIMLAALAAISFLDAFRYHRTGDADRVLLQLPAGLKRFAHSLISRGLRSRRLPLAGAGLGAAVTIVESVCTGQAYLPTLVVAIKSGNSAGLALSYLALYNLMFVLPLAIALVLTCRGLTSRRLLAWSRRNVTAAKLLLGIFFLCLLAMLVYSLHSAPVPPARPTADIGIDKPAADS